MRQEAIIGHISFEIYQLSFAAKTQDQRPNDN